MNISIHAKLPECQYDGLFHKRKPAKGIGNVLPANTGTRPHREWHKGLQELARILRKPPLVVKVVGILKAERRSVSRVPFLFFIRR